MQTNTTGAGTGYFVGGVPQELQALALSLPDPQMAQTKRKDEITMKAVGSGELIPQTDFSNEQSNPIKEFKMKNFQNNMKGIFMKPGEPDPLGVRTEVQAPPENKIDHDAYEKVKSRDVAHVEEFD